MLTADHPQVLASIVVGKDTAQGPPELNTILYTAVWEGQILSER